MIAAMAFAHVHRALVRIAADGDEAAPGGAVTLALCGAWDHDGPWPLAPHRTDVAREGDLLRVLVSFDAPAHVEPEVRRRIGAALGAGRLVGPDGRETRWAMAGAAG